nr:G8 domain-containing protein [Bacteroidia bacterium]
MKRLIVLLVVIICTTFTITVLGQDQFESGHLTPNSNWNNGYGMTQMPSGSGKFLYEGTSPGTGNQYFRLWYSVGPTKYGPSGTSDVQINMNTETALTNWNSSAGKAYYFATTNAYKYIIKSNGNNSMNVICFEIQGAVQSVSTVTRSVASPTNVDVVTVTATLGAAFNTGQAAYLRYTTNAWGSSTVVPMTGSGTTYTANIPAQTGGTTVSYNVFTSGSASGVSTNLTTTPSKSDWYTININNNSGSNYSYTVTTGCSTGTWMGTTSSDWNTASNWGCSILPTSSTNVTIPSGTTYSPVISTGSTALANSITINSGATLTISGTTNLNITSGGTITNNGTFTSSTCPSATVTFLGSGTIGGSSVCTFPNLTLTGTVTLNNNINVTGNFTSAAQKVNNGKTVTFNGNCAGAQTIARTGGGTEYFTAMVIDKSAGSLTLSSSPATNVSIDDPSAATNIGVTTLTIKNAGKLDINGQIFTMNGGAGGTGTPNARAAILVDGATGGTTKTIFSTIADGTFNIRGTFRAGLAGVEVNGTNSGKLLFDNYVNVNTNIGFAPTDITTIGYKLELLGVSAYNGGFVSDLNNTNSTNGHPVYAIGSTLIYNNVVGVPFDRNREWDASGVQTAGVTPGYPYNVLIKGNTKVGIGINTTSGIDNRAVAN